MVKFLQRKSDPKTPAEQMDTCTKSKRSKRVIGAQDQGGHHEQNNDSNYGNQNYSLHGTMAAADYGMSAKREEYQSMVPEKRCGNEFILPLPPENPRIHAAGKTARSGRTAETHRIIRNPHRNLRNHSYPSRNSIRRTAYSNSVRTEVMLKEIASVTQVYLVTGYTDLRLGIDGLAALVQGKLELDPYSRALFLFCGRRRDRIKAILWEGDGFLLLYKRLDNGCFRRPRNESEAKLLTEQEVRWLFEGLELEQPKAIKPGRRSTLY